MRNRWLGAGVIVLVVGLAMVSSQAIQVTPVIFDAEVPGGSEQSTSFTVVNDEAEPVSIEIALCDWRRDVQGNNRFCEDAGDVARSATPWVSVTPQQFDLAAEERRDVQLRLDVPETGPNGDPLEGTYWSAAMIAASPKTDDDEDGGTRIVVKRRFGLKVILDLRGTGTERGQVSNLRQHGLNPLWLQLEFQNRGTLNLRDISGRVEIRNDQGETIEQIDIQSFPILPGATRRLRVQSERPEGDRLPPGRYVALAILDYGAPNPVGAQAVFDVPTLDLRPLGEAENAPQDLNGNGFYEDVDGDGDVTLDDPALLGFAVDSPAVQENWPAFDFNNDGQATFDDVISLKNQIKQDN